MVFNLYRFVFFVGDWVVLNASIFFANVVYSNFSNLEEGIDIVYLIIYSNLTWVFLILVSDTHNVSKNWFVSKVIKSQLAFILIHLVVVLSLIILFNKTYPAFLIGLIYLFLVPIIFVLRIFLYNINIRLEGNRDKRKFVLIGINDVSREIRRYFLINKHLKYKFLGYYDIFSEESFDNFKFECIRNDVNEIFYCSSVNEYKSQLIDFGLDSLIQVKLFAGGRLQSHQLIQLEREERILPVNVVTIPLDDSRNRLLKRIFDIAFSIFVIIFLLSWLLPIAAVIIKLDSNGPVFFIQARSGQNDIRFGCIKLRTMVINKEADEQQAIENDPRITKIGAFLRRTCIDEFPQFFNVLKGSMSTVGPRPLMLRHKEEYSKLIEKFMGRHYVKPGVTGLAQCLGYRGEIKGIVDMENRVRLDRHYIENWSFWKDIKIIFWTVISIVKGD